MDKKNIHDHLLAIDQVIECMFMEDEYKVRRKHKDSYDILMNSLEEKLGIESE